MSIDMLNNNHALSVCEQEGLCSGQQIKSDRRSDRGDTGKNSIKTGNIGQSRCSKKISGKEGIHHHHKIRWKWRSGIVSHTPPRVRY